MAVPQGSLEHPASAEQPTGSPNCGTQASSNPHESLAHLGAELLRRAEESQPMLEKAWDELLAGWGIHGEPVGVERLRALIQQESGVDPLDSQVSREIIARREERHS